MLLYALFQWGLCLFIVRGLSSVKSSFSTEKMFENVFFCKLFFFRKYLFSCSLTFLTHAQYISTVNMWNGHCGTVYPASLSEWRFFQNQKGAIETLNIDIFSLSFESIFWKLCVFLITLFSSIFSFLVLIGPLTKKHTDDLSDSDRTDDEGIFSPPRCQTDLHDKGNQTYPFSSNFYLLWFSYISCPFFESDGHFLFALYS